MVYSIPSYNGPTCNSPLSSVVYSLSNHFPVILNTAPSNGFGVSFSYLPNTRLYSSNFVLTILALIIGCFSCVLSTVGSSLKLPSVTCASNSFPFHTVLNLIGASLYAYPSAYISVNVYSSFGYNPVIVSSPLLFVVTVLPAVGKPFPVKLKRTPCTKFPLWSSFVNLNVYFGSFVTVKLTFAGSSSVACSTFRLLFPSNFSTCKSPLSSTVVVNFISALFNT